MSGSITSFGDRVLFLHAHPDDESLSTGGTIAALLAHGASVRVVTATRGERGEVMPGEFAHLEGSAALVPVRMKELASALAALGGPEHAYLGNPPARRQGVRSRTYSDSGMRWGPDGFAVPTHDAGPETLCGADGGEALDDLLAAARDFQPSSIVSYDRRGGYGHPDHVRCHELAAGTARDLTVPFYSVLEPRVAIASDATEPSVVVTLGQFFLYKADAIAAHRTQVRVEKGFYTLTGGQKHPIPVEESFRLETRTASGSLAAGTSSQSR